MKISKNYNAILFNQHNNWALMHNNRQKFSKKLRFMRSQGIKIINMNILEAI